MYVAVYPGNRIDPPSRRPHLPSRHVKSISSTGLKLALTNASQTAPLLE